MGFKVKSSEVLKESLVRILDGRCRFVCAAIQDVETDLRYEHNGDNPTCKAAKVFAPYKPAHIDDRMKNTMPWWPVGSDERIVALKDAIEKAIKAGD